MIDGLSLYLKEHGLGRGPDTVVSMNTLIGHRESFCSWGRMKLPHLVFYLTFHTML
jgi:hypothetical protein